MSQKTLAPEAANMARSKFEELKKLVEQRQQINVELIGRLAKALEKVKAGVAAAGVSSAPPAAASKQAAAKRSSQPACHTAPDPKRPKLDSETDKKIQDIWRMCATVLDFLWKKKNSLVFQRPVDPIRDGVPDYFKFISHPMDLGTIKAKLKERGYNDPREFAADVRLVWRNCATYNQLNTPVRTMGDQLSEDWERKWTELKVEQRWDELLATRDPQTISLDRRIASSARQLLQRVNSVHVLPDADPSRPMTTVEKRKLSIALSELQGNQLAEVLNIIAESLKDINPDEDDEIELDVDQLDNQTLWRLREYCDNVNNKHSTKTTAPPKAGGGGAPRSVHDNGKQQQHSSKPPTRTESGSESDRYSAEQDVKGSNMVEQPQSNGVRLMGQALLQKGIDQRVGDVALGKDNAEAAAVNGACADLGSVRVEEVRQLGQVDKVEAAEEPAEEAAGKATEKVAEEPGEVVDEAARADGARQERGDGEMGQEEDDGGQDSEVDEEETRGAVAQPSEMEAGAISDEVEAAALEPAGGKGHNDTKMVEQQSIGAGDG
ncbi:hypothetical protein Vretimale_16471 [Volvox reticuliferus]|uniref:Bromodomain-containing protein n=1 Tax=Volvox reticuliferus TaxID=1737510 RepID=A0A8J4FLZ2_9CHLO|nr:hypothetical protein Vretifemale_8674 [Volvox reticuliferus]GIM13421.1 hypothetical protein Vretimale_16471 [Volvox reticuliferus]